MNVRYMHPFLLSVSSIARRTWLAFGEANTLPHTAAPFGEIEPKYGYVVLVKDTHQSTYHPLYVE